LTLRFLTEVAILSNWLSTSLSYLMSSEVDGDCLNLMVFM
jgi:hypothetical protein